MNVSEMENLIQQITDQICQQLLSSSYSVYDEANSPGDF